jgi:uncharacterized repeat protein (TIGR01451 family)
VIARVDDGCSAQFRNANANGDTSGGDCSAGSGTDTITFGVTGTITLASVLPDIADQLTISGTGASQLTISGNEAVQVLRSPNIALTLSLAHLTVANGSALQGGALFNCGLLYISNSAFVGNVATQTGGAIYNQGAYMSVGSTTFSGNSAARFGGDIFDQPLDPSHVLLVSGGTFANNSASLGGGIYGLNATLNLSAEFSGNSATISGGAIWSYTDTSVLVRTSTLASNTAGGIGGGLSNEGGAFTLLNSTVANNSSGSIGGGIYNLGSLTVIHATLSGNSAIDLGSAIRNATTGATATLRNSIVAGSAAKPNCAGPIVDGGYNIDTGTSCAFSQANGSKGATDPRLDTSGLQFNSGTTKTLALQPNSPAVNAVPLAACTDQNNTALSADQRGAGRPYGPACDIGAYELQQDPPPLPPASADLSVSQSADRDPVVTSEGVTFTITASNAGSDAAQNVVVTEQMQQFATFISASAECSYANSAVTCNLASLAAGANASVQVTISSPLDRQIVTFAVVSSNTGDPVPTNTAWSRASQ